jgi:hypothetical protein
MKQDGSISQAEAIHQIAAQMVKPMNLDDFINRVLEIWPSRAKKSTSQCQAKYSK